MFEKIFGSLFVKSVKKSKMTVISGKREIKTIVGAVKKSDLNAEKSERSQTFWDNRGKVYGALFTSLNGRTF